MGPAIGSCLPRRIVQRRARRDERRVLDALLVLLHPPPKGRHRPGSQHFTRCALAQTLAHRDAIGHTLGVGLRQAFGEYTGFFNFLFLQSCLL